jgi:hypothetical protein
MIRKVKQAFLAALRRNALLLCAFGSIPATGCAAIRPAAVVANDIARDLCALHYSEREGVSLDDAARTFCQDLRPWLDLVLRAQRDGVPRDGGQ